MESPHNTAVVVVAVAVGGADGNGARIVVGAGAHNTTHLVEAVVADSPLREAASSYLYW